MSGLVLKSTVDLQFIIVDDGSSAYHLENWFRCCSMSESKSRLSINYILQCKKIKIKLIKLMKLINPINHKNKYLLLFYL